jgi:hypothetical protein
VRKIRDLNVKKGEYICIFRLRILENAEMGVRIKAKYLTEDRRPQDPVSISLRTYMKFVTQEK